jgi:hypothetical protein
MKIQADRYRRVMQTIYSALQGTLHPQNPKVLAARDALREALANEPDGASELDVFLHREEALSKYIAAVDNTVELSETPTKGKQ